jgi:hypothetical protein
MSTKEETEQGQKIEKASSLTLPQKLFSELFTDPDELTTN